MLYLNKIRFEGVRTKGPFRMPCHIYNYYKHYRSVLNFYANITFAQAGDLVSPPRVTKFEKECTDQQDAIYDSKKKAPLGSSHTRGPGLPSGVDPLFTSFGQNNIRTEGAGDMIRPQKTTLEVEKDFHAGRELYKKVQFFFIWR